METESGRESIVHGITKIDAILQNMSRSLHFTNCIMGAKAQSGMPTEMGALPISLTHLKHWRSDSLHSDDVL